MEERNEDVGMLNKRRIILKSIGVTLGAPISEVGAVSASTAAEEDRATGWTTARANPRRTGAIEDTGPAPSATIDWKMDLDGGMSSREPIVARETVYFAVTTATDADETHGFVGAYDAATGEQQWKRDGLPSPKTPVFDGKTLYVATNVPETAASPSGGLYAIDAENGTVKWSRRDPLRWASPIVADGRLYLSNEKGASLLDSATGETIWNADGVGTVADGNDGALSYANETVFFSDGTALNAANGAVQWNVNDRRSTFGNHVVDDERVYSLRTEFIEDDETSIVEARSAIHGTALWTHTIDGKRTIDRRFAVADGNVLFYDSRDALTALDAQTGTQNWSTALSGESFSNLAVANGTVYLGGRQRLPSSPGRGRAVIYAVDLATGDRKWTYSLDSSELETSPEVPPAAGTPVVTDGRLYTATYPAGSTFDYQYSKYANFLALESSTT